MKKKQKISGKITHNHLRPLSGKIGQRLFSTQQSDPRPRLFCPVRACEAVFSPEWGNDPHQAPKSRIRPHKGKVEKSPDKSTGRGVKKEQEKG